MFDVLVKRLAIQITNETNNMVIGKQYPVIAIENDGSGYYFIISDDANRPKFVNFKNATISNYE